VISSLTSYSSLVPLLDTPVARTPIGLLIVTPHSASMQLQTA